MATLRHFLSSAILIAITSLLSGCLLSAPSVMTHRPADRVVDEAVTRLWAREIRSVAQPGDWLLSRSYSAIGDAIVLATPGEELSHAAIVDPERGTVIEAITPEVREVSIEDFVRRNRYVMVVRPADTTDDDRRAALARARSAVGTGFDYSGVLGIDDERTFYCTELVYWASDLAVRRGDHHTILMPSDLLAYGQVMYFSGRRDDPQMLRVAGGWLDERASAAERTAVMTTVRGRPPAAIAAARSAPGPAVSTTSIGAGTIDTFTVDTVEIQRSSGR